MFSKIVHYPRSDLPHSTSYAINPPQILISDSLSIYIYIYIYPRNISISYSITKNIMLGLVQPCDTSVYMYIFNVARRTRTPFTFHYAERLTKQKERGIPFCCQLRRRGHRRAPRDSCSIISMSFDLDIGISTANYYSLLSYVGFLCPFQLLIVYTYR